LIPLLKILAIVVTLVVFLRFKLNLTLAILFTTVLTVVLLGINLKEAILSSGQILIEAKTLQLFIIILMVLYIGSILKSKGFFDRLINSLNCMIRDKRIVAMVGPSIIGFLPSPGGALLSAPLVDVSTKEMNLKPEFLTFLNFWFRHFWEFIWPVYAGLLIFQRISDIPLKKIILYQSPFTLLNILTGLIVSIYYFKKHGIKQSRPESYNDLKGTLKDFFAGVWPFLLIIILFFIFFHSPLSVIGSGCAGYYSCYPPEFE